MKDILFECGGCKILAEVNGLWLTYRYEGDNYYFTATLLEEESYWKLKKKLQDIIDSAKDSDEAVGVANDFLQSYDMEEYFYGKTYIHSDNRTEDEIVSYMKEAEDKVWLMRSCYIARREPTHEVGRPAMERIFNTYSDIPKDGYTDWECGYWNGILGALHWVLGEEKDFLDT